VAFDGTGTQVAQRLIWSPQEQVLGKVILERMVVSQLDDYREDREGGYWPTHGMLRLGGLTYGGISSVAAGKADAKQRLEWIRYQYEPPVGFRAAWKARRDKQSAPADQADFWAPNADASRPWDWLSVWVTYVSTGLGWLFATLAVAGYTGLARNASSP
jgi:hypothetical protein